MRIIAGRNVMEINAKNINNLGGTLTADTLTASARQDLNNIGREISGVGAANATAGRDLNITSTTQSSASGKGLNSFAQTGIDRVAGLYVKGSTGTLVASAGRDLNLTAAAVSNAGTGDTKLSAGKDLNLSTVTTGSSQSLNWDANNHLRQSNSQDVGSQINAAGHLSLTAGNDLNTKAASVSAGQALSVNAGNNVNISAGEASETFDEARKSTNKGVLSSTTTTTTQIKSASTTALGSSFEGNSVAITAGQDLSVKGSNVLADQNVNLAAGGNVNITAAQNTASQSSFNQTTTSGLMSGGGIGFTVGSRMQSVDGQGQSTTAAGSTVGSTGGNVTINAGKTYTQTGSDILTPAGDIAITAQKVDINEARETGSQSTEQKFKQSGLTVAVTSPVLSAVQMASSQINAAGNTSSGRMQALAAANAAFNLKQGADAIAAGQGDANGMVKSADGKMVEGNAADKAGGIGISASIGASSSQSKQQSSADSAKGSNLNAGGNVTIQATGAGTNSDITLQGSDITAGGKASLKADDQVNIVAAQNTTQESSTSKNSNASIGVGINLGSDGLKAGVTVSAAAGKGQGAGNGVTYTNSHVSADQINIESGGDTNVKGGVVSANQVTANVGGNLNMASLQDSSRYNEKSQQVGGSVTFGPAAGGSLNVGQTKVNSDYKSVGEQSAIRAGDGGFNVNVQNKTDLIGGQITSTQAAIDNNKNSYEAKQGTTTTDLNNSAKYSANSVSVGVGAGSPAPGAALSASMSGVGFGNDKGSANSTTTAGISGITGNTSARTGDKETGLTQIFDKDKVQKEVSAQVAITSEFGKQASKIGGTEADKQRDALKAQANAETDPDKKAALQAESAKWDEGGAYRVAMHTVIGGLTGGAAGAVGAGAGSAVAPTLNELQSQLETNLQKAGLGDSASKVIAGLASGTTAAAIGAAASGGSVAGGATAFNADMNNRQLHPSEVQRAKDLASKSGGKYTQAQIEEQMRLMGNAATGEQPNTTTALTNIDAIVNSLNNDPSMPKTAQGSVVMEVPGQANPELQAWIINNTTQSAGFIPGQSPYTLSNAGVNKPTTTNAPTSPPVTAVCANNDLACRSGVGAQQSTIPQLTQDAREAIAGGASSLSRQAGVVAATATAATAAASPQIKPITGSVAIGATVIGVAADAVEQMVTPDLKKVLSESVPKIIQDRIDKRLPIAAPLTNELAELWKNSGTNKDLQTWSNEVWSEYLKKQGVGK